MRLFWGMILLAMNVLGFHGAANASAFYGLPPEHFVAKHWEGQNKFLTTIVAAERKGYLLDYNQLAQSLSPWLVGEDALLGEGDESEVYRSLITRLKIKQTDFVRFEMSLDKALIYDVNDKVFIACVSERDVLSKPGMADLKHKVSFEASGPRPSAKMKKRCRLPIVIQMTENQRMQILSDRALNGVKATRSLQLRGKLSGVEPTRSIPSVMGYRWILGLSALIDEGINYTTRER